MPRIAFAALVFASLELTGCASVLRSSTQPIWFRNAPDDLIVLHDGDQIPLARREGGNRLGELPVKTQAVTLKLANSTTEVELEKRTAVGWVIADFLLFWPGLIVDAVSQKWKNFDDVDVQVALAAAHQAPARTAVVDATPPRPSPPQAQPARKQDRVQPQPSAETVAMREVDPRSQQRGQPLMLKGKVAVLDLRNTTELKAEQVRYFADVVRGSALRAAPGLEVMTRENLLVLLAATGRDAANCEGECEVDTGRRIGADAVVSGEILKVGTRYKLSLRLHETRDGRLLSTSVASGRSIDELDEATQAAAAELMAPAR